MTRADRYPDAVRFSIGTVATDALPGVRDAILGWYYGAQRDFPWRGTTDPWAVLVSEVMLQQTQASRVSERFPTFMARFPTAGAMAGATDRDVLAAWSGLGYNRRALSLRRAAIAVDAGGWPADVAGLQRLPGVGPYTARAVAALAFGQAVGAVDTNVRRWLVRRFGVPPSAAAGTLQELADGLAAPATNARQAGDWMHASMEFGARICRARMPGCVECPVARGCPSRGLAVHVPVPRQSPFDGSARAVRGAILRELARAPGNALPTARLARMAHVARVAGAGDRDGRQLNEVLDALEREGLAHRTGRRVHLGPADHAATIEP